MSIRVSLSCLAFLAAIALPLRGEEKKAATFDKFKALEGEWVGKEVSGAKGVEGDMTVKYKLTAGGSAVIFSSGGVMAATIRIALDLSPQRTLELSWTPRNGAYAEFLFSGERFSLNAFNAYPHLDSPDLLTWR